jgi:hypothetical protein
VLCNPGQAITFREPFSRVRFVVALSYVDDVRYWSELIFANEKGLRSSGDAHSEAQLDQQIGFRAVTIRTWRIRWWGIGAVFAGVPPSSGDFHHYHLQDDAYSRSTSSP